VPQGFQFFSCAAEHGWIAAFEAHNDFVGRGVADEERLDFVLRQELSAAAFADVDHFRCRRNGLQYFAAYERVVKHDVGGGEKARSL
jgi:hypothetical protein